MSQTFTTHTYGISQSNIQSLENVLVKYFEAETAKAKSAQAQYEATTNAVTTVAKSVLAAWTTSQQEEAKRQHELEVQRQKLQAENNKMWVKLASAFVGQSVSWLFSDDSMSSSGTSSSTSDTSSSTSSASSTSSSSSSDTDKSKAYINGFFNLTGNLMTDKENTDKLNAMKKFCTDFIDLTNMSPKSEVPKTEEKKVENNEEMEKTSEDSSKDSSEMNAEQIKTLNDLMDKTVPPEMKNTPLEQNVKLTAQTMLEKVNPIMNDLLKKIHDHQGDPSVLFSDLMGPTITQVSQVMQEVAKTSITKSTESSKDDLIDLKVSDSKAEVTETSESPKTSEAPKKSFKPRKSFKSTYSEEGIAYAKTPEEATVEANESTSSSSSSNPSSSNPSIDASQMMNQFMPLLSMFMGKVPGSSQSTPTTTSTTSSEEPRKPAFEE